MTSLVVNVDNKRDEKFFEDLYVGLGVEHYTISQLFLLGYEAYKMPADFGFDLMTSNQMAKAFGKKHEQDSKFFQIKSRVIHPTDYKKYESSAGIRKKADKYFSFKKADFDVICNEPYAYIVFYFLEQNNNTLSILSYFWLTSSHLITLKELGYISEKDDCYHLTAEYRTCANAKGKLQAELKSLITSEMNCDKLGRVISKVDVINKNTKPYIRLYKNDLTGTSLQIDDLYSLDSLNNKIVLKETSDGFINDLYNKQAGS